MYSPHTAFDNTRGGINDSLATRLGLTAIRPLRTREIPPQLKLVVFVPDKDLAAVSDAVFSAARVILASIESAAIGYPVPEHSTVPRHRILRSVRRAGEKKSPSGVWRWFAPKDDLTPSWPHSGEHSYEEPAFDLIRCVRYLEAKAKDVSVISRTLSRSVKWHAVSRRVCGSRRSSLWVRKKRGSAGSPSFVEPEATS